MSGYISGAVWISGPKHHNQRYVLLAIADNANDHGYCWPSVETIVEKCLISKSTVLRCLESLEHDGWLQINKKAVEYRGNSYQIVLEKLSFERPKSGVRLKPEKKSQVSINKSQVSTDAESGVINDIAIRKNLQEPSLEPSFYLQPPDEPKQKKATRIPIGFDVTNTHRVWAQANHMPNPSDHIEEFRDYWTAKPGPGAVKLDWDATFRTWLRNAASRNGNGNSKYYKESRQNIPMESVSERMKKLTTEGMK
jgi:hypothetical protein